MAWCIKVTQISDIQKHPNADSLEIGSVDGQPVITRLGEYKDGDKVVYIPVDSIVPDTEQFAFLKGHFKVKAKKLRGIFSCGLVVPAKPEWEIGQDVQSEMNIEKYDAEAAEEQKYKMRGDIEWPSFTVSKYDIDNARKYHRLMQVGEPYVVTEKVHGGNSRFVWSENRLWCGSRQQWKKESDEDLWWKIARKYDLTAKLSQHPNLILFGEVYGKVANLRYGLGNNVEFAAFDVYDLESGRFLDFDDYVSFCRNIDVPMVPVLYEGEWDENSFAKCLDLAEQDSMISLEPQIAEGVVIKPRKERWDEHIGRIIIKLHGERYLLLK